MVFLDNIPLLQPIETYSELSMSPVQNLQHGLELVLHELILNS